MLSWHTRIAKQGNSDPECAIKAGDKIDVHKIRKKMYQSCLVHIENSKTGGQTV